MAAPKVSVVMPAYKAAGFIAAAVASVRAQTLQDWELIVVDDCSPDDTAAAVEAAGEGDRRIRIVRAAQNGGVARARNLGNEHARGDWIAVMDSDDAMEPQRLETLIAAAEAKGLDIIADDMMLVPFGDAEAPGQPYLGLTAPLTVSLASWLGGNRPHLKTPILGFLKPIFRRESILRAGVQYLPDLKVAEDCWFVADLLAEGARFEVHPEALYRYAVRPASLSRTRGGQNVFSMQRPVYEPFRARHAGKLTPEDLAALDRHEGRLRDAEAYEAFIIAVRSGNILGAAGALAGRPLAARFMGMTIAAKAAKLARKAGYTPALRVG